MSGQQQQQQQPSFNIENVQPLHPGATAMVSKAGLALGHSEMGGKALLAKKMAASGQTFYSPSDSMISPCTAKLHLAKKKHFTKGKPLALSSSFATSNTNPFQPVSQNVPLSKEGFLHPSHAQQAQHALAHQGQEQHQHEGHDSAKAQDSDDDVEMEM